MLVYLQNSCIVYVIVYTFFPCECFLSVYLPFCFLSYLNVVFNSFRIHTCYALALVSDISQIFLLKLIWNSSCDALYWWTIHVSLLFAWKSMNDCDWMIIFPLLGFCVWNSALSLSLTPLPNGISVVSTTYLT